jgi:hypothetical protein
VVTLNLTHDNLRELLDTVTVGTKPYDQGCQTVYFQTKNLNLSSILEGLRMEYVCIVYGHLEYTTAIFCHIFWSFGNFVHGGIVCQEKYGNPAYDSPLEVFT